MVVIKQCLFFMAICVVMTSCVTTQRTDLFFGTDIPGGGHVSPQQWKSFSDSAIASRFPGGYTEWDADGRWLDKETRQTITEHTRIVTLIGKKGKEREAALNAVTQAYIIQYKQQAVLRLDTKSRVQFISAAHK